MRKTILSLAAVASVVTAAPALADPPGWAPAHGRRAHERSLYDAQGRYYEPRALTRSDRVWRGDDGRYYCRRNNGTTGLIIGGIAGGILGNIIAPGDSKTIGTVIGALGGAAVGTAIDTRSGVRCR